METGKIIKELRLEKGMTQLELADKTEVSARTIQRIENGEVDPRAYTLQMIAKALDVDYSLFVEQDSKEKAFEQGSQINSRSVLLHLTGIFPLLFPTYLVWKYKASKTKDEAMHYKASITMQLCIWFIILVGMWIYWIVNQPIPLIIGILIGALVAIANAIFVALDKPIINPFISKQA